MPTIFDVVTAKDTKAYIENTGQKTYLGEVLFPTSKQLGLDLSYLKGRGGAPVALQPASFDATAPLRDRIGVQGINTEMPFFRERMLVKEKERQQINTFIAAGQTAHAELLIQEVYKDSDNLYKGAQATRERMRMQVLSTGAIAITATAEGRAVNYNYGLDNAQFETLTGSSAWTHADADPIADIEEWKDKVGASRAILNSFTLGLLKKNGKVIDAVATYTGKKYISTNDVINFFKEELGVSFAVYDEKYKATLTGAEEKFWPNYKFTLIPEGTLGETVYGTTPEESDLLTGATEAEVEIADKGIAITTRKIVHPVNVETIVSMIALPSFPEADKVFIATVGA